MVKGYLRPWPAVQHAVGEIVVESKPEREFQDGVRRLPRIPEVCSRLTMHTPFRATARCRPE
jgi:hypothetical protein